MPSRSREGSFSYLFFHEFLNILLTFYYKYIATIFPPKRLRLTNQLYMLNRKLRSIQPLIRSIYQENSLIFQSNFYIREVRILDKINNHRYFFRFIQFTVCF